MNMFSTYIILYIYIAASYVSRPLDLIWLDHDRWTVVAVDSGFAMATTEMSWANHGCLGFFWATRHAKTFG